MYMSKNAPVYYPSETFFIWLNRQIIIIYTRRVVAFLVVARIKQARPGWPQSAAHSNNNGTMISWLVNFFPSSSSITHGRYPWIYLWDICVWVWGVRLGFVRTLVRGTSNRISNECVWCGVHNWCMRHVAVTILTWSIYKKYTSSKKRSSTHIPSIFCYLWCDYCAFLQFRADGVLKYTDLQLPGR